MISTYKDGIPGNERLVEKFLKVVKRERIARRL
jgi:hypothetical protein